MPEVGSARATGSTISSLVMSHRNVSGLLLGDETKTEERAVNAIPRTFPLHCPALVRRPYLSPLNCLNMQPEDNSMTDVFRRSNTIRMGGSLTLKR